MHARPEPHAPGVCRLRDLSSGDIMDESDSPAPSHNAAAGQFEVRTARGVALLKYVPEGDVLDLVHTEVPKDVEGRGVGSALARAALDYARVQHLSVKPTCPFVRAFISKHAEYADLIVKG